MCCPQPRRTPCRIWRVLCSVLDGIAQFLFPLRAQSPIRGIAARRHEAPRCGLQSIQHATRPWWCPGHPRPKGYLLPRVDGLCQKVPGAAGAVAGADAGAAAAANAFIFSTTTHVVAKIVAVAAAAAAGAPAAAPAAPGTFWQNQVALAIGTPFVKVYAWTCPAVFRYVWMRLDGYGHFQTRLKIFRTIVRNFIFFGFCFFLMRCAKTAITNRFLTNFRSRYI